MEANHQPTKTVEAPKKVEKVVSGAVTSRKKSELRKFADVFIVEDVKKITDHIINDTLIPTIKDALYDVVSGGLSMLLYGDSGKSGKRSTAAGKVLYGNFYNNNKRESAPPKNRVAYDYDEIVIKNRGEAEEVLEAMKDLLCTYGTVSVADLYDLVGVSCNYTDNNYGWTKLDDTNSGVEPVRGGYTLKLPRVIALTR